MNLISRTHHLCERREHVFIVFREYTIISRSIATENHQDLQTQHLTPPHTIPFSPNPLKRKVIEKELNIFAKRMRKANSGQEPLYFDPKTIALIPQSRLDRIFHSQGESKSRG